MARAYSYDLRLKVMNFIASGKLIKEASAVFKISRKTINDWKKLKKETGDIKAKSGYHTGHRKIIKDVEGFKKFIEANCDKSSKVLSMLWYQKVCPRTIARLLNKLGYSYKKKLFNIPKGIFLAGLTL